MSNAVENWQTIAAQAWEACDDRKLTKTEKLALVIEAIAEQPDRSFIRINRLASRTPLTGREVASVLRRDMARVNATLDMQLSYNPGYQETTGGGEFGRLGNGGRRGRYHGASVS